MRVRSSRVYTFSKFAYETLNKSSRGIFEMKFLFFEKKNLLGKRLNESSPLFTLPRPQSGENREEKSSIGKIQIRGGEKGWVVEHNFRRSERKRESGVIAREEGKVCPKRGRGRGKKWTVGERSRKPFSILVERKKTEREGERRRTIANDRESFQKYACINYA